MPETTETHITMPVCEGEHNGHTICVYRVGDTDWYYFEIVGPLGITSAWSRHTGPGYAFEAGVEAVKAKAFIKANEVTAR
jgi:hypothetical protein